MNCYKEFSSIYDRLIYNDIDYKKMGKSIIGICKKYNIQNNDYLDLACGTANVTKEVGKNFKNIWAVDLSCDMLGIASDKLREEKIKAKLVCQDMSELNLIKKFDLITCVLDSTNYITDENELENYFKKVHYHLKDNGIFIFDINSYYKITEVLGNNIYNYDDEEIVYVWENILEDDIVTMYLTFFVKEGELYKRFDEEHEEKAYSEEFLDNLLNKIGFEILEKLDNYNDNKISTKTERIVYILRKKISGGNNNER
ncbi:class I SAM-dependent methyltransferase [Clostridium sp. MB40-C1]|uniref:class I SAM-dependent DNA methyltransferase n=1 Tax=Clostridium sp. MB40-C1 TaxID=3070996 RepID=UPI0027E1C4B9|nr:class I SAM-dependent methyltransferase [Clostridium sp. MB40-C1]WMJ81090.1 class I SAM-dependent methyltransferase [Clostridium sp. MB40-C1]